MVEIYGTDNGIVHALDSYSDGCWVKMTEPASEEVGALSRFFDIDTDDMQAAKQLPMRRRQDKAKSPVSRSMLRKSAFSHLRREPPVLTGRN